ncbi:MAG: hypothetical protein HZB46_14505, partial [Solirubrobacterales bacterium]|nr:hypothetical protein [Solirubrobacterales bacterium]
MSAPLFAALAAALGVWGAWEALGALEEATLPSRLRRALVPLRLAGRAGREPTDGERRRLAVLGAA